MASNRRYRLHALDGLILLLLLGLVYFGVSLRLQRPTAQQSEVQQSNAQETEQLQDVSSSSQAAQPVTLNLQPIALPLPPPPAGQTLSDNPATQGAGPSVVWRWPAAMSARADLYGYLRQCAHIELGVMLKGRVRRLSASVTEVPMSSLVRVVQGPLTPSEQLQFQHRGLRGEPVRLFAEAFDQKVVRQLQNIIGGSFDSAKSLTGNYQFIGGYWYLTKFKQDERAIPGAIKLDEVCVHLL